MTIEKKPLLRLTSDFVFKAVYGQDTPESQAALRALLNCLLDKKDDPIEWVRCENPFILPKYIGRKESVLDIKARLSSGQLIDLEMQVTYLTHFINRSIFYMGKLITSSLDKGQNYGKMKLAIVISIVDGILFPDTPDVHSRYTLHERDRKDELSTLTQIHYLELNKIDITKPISEMTPYERIGAFFKYVSDRSKQDLIAELFHYESEVMTMTTPILEEISMDDQMRYLEEEHENYLRDLATALYEAEEARIEGRNQGLAEGMIRTNLLTKELLNAGRLDDLTRALDDKDFQEQLFKEFEL
ncbi:MAG: Rpn family recombination-promoting nuclease/putative transposase [Firmicutes bacterium]|nr:Rpn family recombination-promoting nuclease/putative transposase [Bacillota bacterium]